MKRILFVASLVAWLCVPSPVAAQNYFPFGSVALGTASSGIYIGPFGCYVNTSDPTYANATIAPCSLTTTGKIRVTAALEAGTLNIGDVDIASMPADATELPAAAALADATANPTLPSIGVFPHTFNGTTWDRASPADGGGGAVTTNTTRVVPAQQTPFKSIDLDETEEEVKDTAGEVCSVWVTNTATSTRWLKFYAADMDDVVVGTTVSTVTIGIPGNASDDVSGSFSTGNGCLAFANAITVAATTGVADDDSGAPGANEVIVMIGFR